MRGGADKSYGVQVAKLAGIPQKVIDRAKELVAMLSDADIARSAADSALVDKKHEAKKESRQDAVDANQLSFFDTVNENDILKELQELDIGKMTPVEALNILYSWQNLLKNRI